MAVRGVPQTIPELLSEARGLHVEGRIAEAANLYQHILEREPANLNALHLYGVLSLQAGQVQQAIRSIEKAIEVDATRSVIHFNLGNAYLQAGQLEDSIGAYRRALAIDNGMADAWCALGAALVRAGQYEDAIAAAGQALQLEPQSSAAHSCIGTARQAAGQLPEALESFERARAISPEDPDLLNKTGFACYESGRFEDAATFCQRATQLAPEFGPAYFNLGLALTESGRLAAACKALSRASALIPGSAFCHNALGRALLLRGTHDEALQQFTRAAQLDPQMESACNNLGLALQRLGKLQAAAQEYEKALALKPDYRDAWLNLAVLHEQSNQLDEAAATIDRGLQHLPQDPALTLIAARLERRGGEPAAALAKLDTLSEAGIPAELQRRVLFERGRLANLLEREDEAFDYFSQGNQLLRESPAGRYFLHQAYGQQVQALARGMRGGWSGNWRETVPDDDDAPVFLLGFPRSGTTLLEQILGAHPGLVALEEEALIAGVGQKLDEHSGDYPALLGDLSDDDRRELRSSYLQLARERTQWQPGQLLLDKFPLNTVHLPLIHCLFPDARILLALRHPCDVALSCFMQEFELNDAMVNFTSLEDTALLYDAVMSICHAARAALPLQLREVRYESLIDDLEGEVRGVLDFLGLDWRSEVLDFATRAKAKSRIQTPSYEQVSQPLYREARLRWQRYRSHLAVLEPTLQPHCERFAYSLAASPEPQPD